jgi:hypothetical protein
VSPALRLITGAVQADVDARRGGGRARSELWAKPFVWIDPATLPPRQWLYRPHFVRSYLTVTFAKGGVGKTTLAIVEALAVATGKPLLGVQPSERARVWLWNGEDPSEELQKRVQAAMLYFGIDASEVEGWLFVGSGRDLELTIAEQTRDGARADAGVVEEAVAFIEANGVGLVVIDPFVSSHRVSENDNGAIDLVAKTWGRVADRTSCAVHLVHHSRKTNGQETTVEDGRGASALVDASRHARTLNPMSASEADHFGVQRQNRSRFVRVDDGKANLAPPAAKAEWIQLVSVALGNGDNIQVAERWTPPDPFEDLTQADIRRIQETVAAGRPESGEAWRESYQAKGGAWVGCAVAAALKWDLDETGVTGRVKEVLRTLIRAGELRVEYRPVVGKTKNAPFVVVGHWAVADVSPEQGGG